MPRKKKRPKLPNGYGSIKYLGRNRRNPYAVHPPTTEFSETGIPCTPKALCYVDDWYVGFAVLTAYKAGTYTPGMEKDLKKLKHDGGDLNDLAKQILADYNRTVKTEETESDKGPTFDEVYHQFYNWKYCGKKEYAESTLRGVRASFQNFASLHGKIYSSINFEEMQDIIDNSKLKHASIERMVSLQKQMGAYAKDKKYVPENPALPLRVNIANDDVHGVPFTEQELKKFWQAKENDTAITLLILCYSGLRIGELNVVKIDLQDNYFKGGIKTPASKNKIVPIHSSILPLVKHRLAQYDQLLPMTPDAFRKEMAALMEQFDMVQDPPHTPHDCRHTFSKLCEDSGVRENDRKRMLGHAFTDVTNKVYGHRDIDALRAEIEKIKVCY